MSELRIEFYAVVELPTGDEITVPMDELGYEETIRTDIFDEGGDVCEPIDSNGDDAEADDDESLEEDGTVPDEKKTNGDSDGDEIDDEEESDDDSGDGEEDGLPL